MSTSTSTTTIHDLWRRGQEGWPRSFPVAQLPNAPLIVGLAGIGIAKLTDGDVHDVAYAVSRVGLVIWAYEELAHGVNWFRRLLGAVALVWLVVSLAGDLG
jgi:hypothetical protein